MVKAAVLGYGNIGSGVVQVLLKNSELIKNKVGEEIKPVCVLDLRDFPGDVMEHNVVRNIEDISDNPEIAVVVETMGGTKPAYAFVKKCLEAGKHVVTSNKELVAAHGEELLKIAAQKNVSFLFEASVGGAIPIIRPLTSCITADEITEITGILNGTTNYMLTQMSENGLEYEDVLKKAMELGYAERNPAADVEGFDACRKIAILASVAYGSYVDYQKVHTEGITEITARDMSYATELGRKIKLFGTCRRGEDGTLNAMVSPVLIGQSHPLYAVDGVMNAILVRGKMTGDLMFYGAGAGKLPTATAVAADVVSAVSGNDGARIKPYSDVSIEVGDILNTEHAYMVRLPKTEAASDEFRTKQKVEIFEDEYALITDVMKESEFLNICSKYKVLNYVRLAE